MNVNSILVYVGSTIVNCTWLTRQAPLQRRIRSGDARLVVLLSMLAGVASPSFSSGRALGRPRQHQPPWVKTREQEIERMHESLNRARKTPIDAASIGTYERIYSGLAGFAESLARGYVSLCSQQRRAPGRVEVWGVGSRFRGPPLVGPNHRGSPWKPGTDIDVIVVPTHSDSKLNLAADDYDRSIGAILLESIGDLPLHLQRKYTNGAKTRAPNGGSQTVLLDMQSMGWALPDKIDHGWLQVGYDRDFLVNGGGGLLLFRTAD